MDKGNWPEQVNYMMLVMSLIDRVLVEEVPLMGH